VASNGPVGLAAVGTVGGNQKTSGVAVLAAVWMTLTKAEGEGQHGGCS
jgi:hypothetical protein